MGEPHLCRKTPRRPTRVNRLRSRTHTVYFDRAWGRPLRLVVYPVQYDTGSDPCTRRETQMLPTPASCVDGKSSRDVDYQASPTGSAAETFSLLNTCVIVASFAPTAVID